MGCFILTYIILNVVYKYEVTNFLYNLEKDELEN